MADEIRLEFNRKITMRFRTISLATLIFMAAAAQARRLIDLGSRTTGETVALPVE